MNGVKKGAKYQGTETAKTLALENSRECCRRLRPQPKKVEVWGKWPRAGREGGKHMTRRLTVEVPQ